MSPSTTLYFGQWVSLAKVKKEGKTENDKHKNKYNKSNFDNISLISEVFTTCSKSIDRGINLKKCSNVFVNSSD